MLIAGIPYHPATSLLMASGYDRSRQSYLPRMNTDTLTRRLRFAPPNPQVKRLVLSEPDFAILRAINRHGPLPTPYLYDFQKHLRKDYNGVQKRLTEFYNGDALGPLLVRPPQQFAAFEARYQHLIYDLAPRARQMLAELGEDVWPRRTEAFLHQFMQACVGASLELTAPNKGIRYINRQEILGKAGAPLALPLGNNAKLIPDDLFGFEYPEGGFRFFAVEIDRNTESIERKNISQNSFGQKVDNYLRVLNEKLFKAWGIPNLSILTVTTNGTHAQNLIEYVKRKNDPRYAGRFAFAWEPCFGPNWRVPKTLLYHLLDEPLATPTEPKDLTKA